MSYHKLLQSVTNISGIADKTSQHLQRLNIVKLVDFLLHIPFRVLNVKINPPVYGFEDGDVLLLKVRLLDLPERPLHHAKSRVKILCKYDKIIIELVFFNFFPNYALPKLNAVEELYVYGKVQRKFGVTSIAHPKFIFEKDPNIENCIPIYHLTYGLVNDQICKWVRIALNAVPQDQDLLPHELIGRELSGVSLYQAFWNLHNPSNQNVLDPNSKYIERIAFDELLAHQLAIYILRNSQVRNHGISFINNGELINAALKQLPFKLTIDQQKVLDEIISDQAASRQMMRLVQGDVGSGKTAVALLAAVNAIASGDYQVAIMSPLDILANQHFEFFCKILEPLNIKVVLLTGKIKGKEREDALRRISNGEVSVVIGTHALFQEKAQFSKLGLVIIDEQHRFGVDQRMRLLAKGFNSDMLMLTATPIPRTLTQIMYADLDLSTISAKPPGRVPIKTSITSMQHLDKIIDSLPNIMHKGEKIYWICPLIEEAIEESKSKQASVEERYQMLSQRFGSTVGYMHGKLSAHEKQSILENFCTGDMQILVATTVIEVGIDIKDATVIVIENAEGYGLSQLHQLRGRVGRANLESYCILLYSQNCSKDAVVRLATLKDTDDGFKIADTDLKLRGGGDLAGTKQSGVPDFRICNLYHHSHLAMKANALAKKILAGVNYEYEQLDEKYKILMRIYNKTYNVELHNIY